VGQNLPGRRRVVTRVLTASEAVASTRVSPATTARTSTTPSAINSSVRFGGQNFFVNVPHLYRGLR
jgi:hypothetical protein